MTSIQEKSKFKINNLKGSVETLPKIVEQLSNVMKITYDHALHEILAISSTIASGLVKTEYEGMEYLCNEYYMLVAETSERKTGTQKYLLQGVKDKHEKYRKEYRKDKANYMELLREYEYAARKHGKSEVGISKPPKPLDPNILVGSDCTKEGLIIEFGSDKNQLKLLNSDDALDFFNAIGMQDSARGRMMTALNKLWSNSDVEETKVKHDGTISIDGSKALMNINFCMQGTVFYRNLCDVTAKEIGFTARYLMTKAEKLAGMRNEIFGVRGVPKGHKYYNEEVEDILSDISALELFKEDLPKHLEILMQRFKSEGVIEPKLKKFSSKAKKLLKDLEISIENSMGENCAYEYYAEVVGKAFQHVINVSVAVDWIEYRGHSSEIESSIVWAAWKIVEYYINQHIEMIDIENKIEKEMSKGAKRFQQWLSKQEGEYISWRKVLSSSSVIKNATKQVREAVITELEELGYIEDCRDSSLDKNVPVSIEVEEKGKKVIRTFKSYIRVVPEESRGRSIKKREFSIANGVNNDEVSNNVEAEGGSAKGEDEYKYDIVFDDGEERKMTEAEILKHVDGLYEKHGAIDPNDDIYWADLTR